VTVTVVVRVGVGMTVIVTVSVGVRVSAGVRVSVRENECESESAVTGVSACGSEYTWNGQCSTCRAGHVSTLYHSIVHVRVHVPQFRVTPVQSRPALNPVVVVSFIRLIFNRTPGWNT